MLALLLLAVQAAPPPERFSILVDPCASRRRTSQDDEILVCGTNLAPRLPLPLDRGPPDRPLASNPYADGRGAIVASASPCATRSDGCTTGVDLIGGGVFAIRAIGKLVDPGSCC